MTSGQVPTVGKTFRPLPSKAQRTPSILARRDTIPADAMANAAAEATAGVEAAGSGGEDDGSPSCSRCTWCW